MEELEHPPLEHPEPERSELDDITDLLAGKASLKQRIYRNTFDLFKQFKAEVASASASIEASMAARDPNVQIRFNERGDFDAEFKFGGDMLVFSMHSNVFSFEEIHPVMDTDYLKDDPERRYCGLINVYNFIADSYKYTRMNDSGILVARIFLNKDSHFLVEGRKLLGERYKDFATQEFGPPCMRGMLFSAMRDALDTDLTPPSYENVERITLQQKLSEIGSAGLRTGKRLGFEVHGSY